MFGLPPSGPSQLHHPSLFGGHLPHMAPNFTPSVHALTLAERLAGKAISIRINYRWRDQSILKPFVLLLSIVKYVYTQHGVGYMVKRSLCQACSLLIYLPYVFFLVYVIPSMRGNPPPIPVSIFFREDTLLFTLLVRQTMVQTIGPPAVNYLYRVIKKNTMWKYSGRIRFYKCNNVIVQIQ